MAWEWDYSSTQKQWTLTVGEWNAVVQRVGSPYRWVAAIERVTDAAERIEGPTFIDAIDARTWCLTKIVELQTNPAAR